jgi:hypothetical protein
MDCLDCPAPIPHITPGRPPKRCPACTAAHIKNYKRDYARQQRDDSTPDDIYDYIEANAPVTVTDARERFHETPADPGALLAKLQYRGLLCWLDGDQIYPFRRGAV